MIPTSPSSQPMGYRIAPPSSPTWTTCSPTWTACSPVQPPPAGYVRQGRQVTSFEPIKLDTYQQQVQNRNMAALPESNPLDTTKDEQFEKDFAAYLKLVQQQADAESQRLDQQQKSKGKNSQGSLDKYKADVVNIEKKDELVSGRKVKSRKMHRICPE